MRGFCPTRQKYRGDSGLADQIAAVLPMSRETSEMSLVFRGFRGIFLAFAGCLFSEFWFFLLYFLYKFLNLTVFFNDEKVIFFIIKFDYIFSLVFRLFSANFLRFFIARVGNTESRGFYPWGILSARDSVRAPFKQYSWY